MPSKGVTALLVAGRRPGIDRLAAAFGVEDKALIDIAGEPMLSRVARVLLGHPAIRHIIILAQEPDRLMRAPGAAWMLAEPTITASPGGHSVSAAVGAALADNADRWPFLVTTADNVLLDDATVGEMIARAEMTGADVAVGLVARSVFSKAYPDARRTWLKFRGEAYSGANLFYLATPTAALAVAFWQNIESQRKRARAVAGAFGLPLLMAYLLRLLSVEQAIGAAGRKLGVVAAPVPLSRPEACIDVDKVEDHALASAILSARADA